jgi:hypothetical protein
MVPVWAGVIAAIRFGSGAFWIGFNLIAPHTHLICLPIFGCASQSQGTDIGEAEAEH